MRMKTPRKDLDKEFEKVLATGEDGEKGVKAAKQIFQQEQKESEEKRNIILQQLDQARNGKIITYNKILADVLRARLSYNDWPPNWQYFVTPTVVGVIMEIHSPTGRIFRAGFKPVGIAKYDLNAVDVYSYRAQNTVDKQTIKPQNSQIITETKNE